MKVKHVSPLLLAGQPHPDDAYLIHEYTARHIADLLL